LYLAFQEDREPITADMVLAVKGTIPLYSTMTSRITALREWASGRAVPANRAAAVDTFRPGRRVVVA